LLDEIEQGGPQGGTVHDFVIFEMFSSDGAGFHGGKGVTPNTGEGEPRVKGV
jgi:hypothetical protein